MARQSSALQRQGDERVSELSSDSFSVLIIEDDQFSQKLFSNILVSRFNIKPVVVPTFDQALEYLRNKNGNLSLVIMDIFLGESRTGVDLYKIIMREAPRTPVIMTSVLDERRFRDLLGDSFREPIFLHKPFHPDYCVMVIDRVLSLTQL